MPSVPRHARLPVKFLHQLIEAAGGVVQKLDKRWSAKKILGSYNPRDQVGITRPICIDLGGVTTSSSVSHFYWMTSQLHKAL